MSDNLLEPNYEPHYTAWSNDPSPQNTSALLTKIHPILTAAVRSYGNRSSPTLFSRAKIMALDAMGRYDPSKAKLKTHLMFQLQGLRRHAAKEQQILSIPEQVGLDLGYVRESENFLKDKLGRDPSDAELADHSNISIKRLGYIRGLKPAYPEGIMQRPGEDGEEIYSPAVVGNNGATDQWHEFVYHDLSGPDQLILEHTLGLHGKPVLSNMQLAKKLKISSGAISQRKAKIQQRLDLRDTLKVL